MKEFLMLGAVLLMQNTIASAPSWPDTTPEIVREKINQKWREEENMSLSENEVLAKAVNRYATILNKIGAPQGNCRSEEIVSLCARNCKKIRNGKLLFEGKEFFATQLDAGKEWLGAWSMDVQEVLISTDNRAATIRYELTTEKEGSLVVIAILHFDSNHLINEINEVHNKSEK